MSDATSITDAIERLPPELALSARTWLERFEDQHGDRPVETELIAPLVRIVAVSEFAATALLRDWAWIYDHSGTLLDPFDRESLAAFADDFASADLSVDEAKKQLRERRRRELLAILWRDLNGSSSVDDTIGALSDVADELLRAAANYAAARLAERFGRVLDSNGNPVDLVILAMGKLGGRELNFSSDIDVIFAYPRGGESDGQRTLDAQSYFDRLSRDVVALMDERTADGFVFRTDTRLRPFGDSGPPVVSFAALESYLVNHGRGWERYAYVKARIVGPQPPEAVRSELFDELVLPFVYRRYLDYGVFESLREMRSKIAAEVARRDRADDVKLGPGGIREVEFFVQSLQIVRGGAAPVLQTPSLLGVVPTLVDMRSIDADAADELLGAYRFLRRLENTIQALGDKQVHSLPTSDVDRARLVFALEFENWGDLLAEFDRQRAIVSAQFGAIAFPDPGVTEVGSDYAELWSIDASEDAWRSLFDERGVRDSGRLAELVAEFPGLPATRRADKVSRERLDDFVPRLLALAEELKEPATAVERALRVVEQILRRSAYLALLIENPLAARRLLALCERSAYIAGQLASFPVLLDELLDPRAITGPLGKAEIRADLALVLGRRPNEDAELWMEGIARSQRTSMFRIAVADFCGDLPIMKVSDSLTNLAEVVLEETLALAWNDLEDRHGVPTFEIDGQRHEAGFGIIGYGKLGGLELSYGSDLDIVFLHNSTGSRQQTDGERPIDNAVFFTRLVRRLVHFLGTQTRTGSLYEVDTRLRPSGRKGLLITSVDACERYQQENAWTLEHQALLRARPVAGSDAVADAFARVRVRTLESLVKRETLRDDVTSMRARMRSELDKSADDRFDLKQGEGGIGDIEFLVQYLVLEHAARSPEVYEYSDNIRQMDALASIGVLSAEEAEELQDIYRRYRKRLHHRVLNDRPASVAVDEFRAERDTVRAAWSRHFGS